SHARSKCLYTGRDRLCCVVAHECECFVLACVLCECDRFIRVEVGWKSEMAVRINQSRYDGAATEVQEAGRRTWHPRFDAIHRDDPSVGNRQRRALDLRGPQPIEEE